ncbi:MAG UNVERIFIED_CONTAM: methylenetetrahydrofolate reductase [Anaerolineae bacterium]
MSPWALCQLLQTQVGLETILHFPTRGRNLLRVQGDLLGAHALGLRNLFVTMGDPTKIRDYPDATDSFDIAPSKLMDVIAHNFNQGTDLGGNSIGKPTHFTVGCALNMFADDLNRELDLLERKIEGGAVFALGQPVFEAHKVEQFLQAYEARFNKTFDFPVLMGIMPLFSLKQARFLHNEVPGFPSLPASLRGWSRQAKPPHKLGCRSPLSLPKRLNPWLPGRTSFPPLASMKLAAQVVNAIR